MPAGYSQRSLADKLGLAPGQRVFFSALPRDVARELGPLAQGSASLRGTFDYLHAFVTTRAELEDVVVRFKLALEPSGMFWISWPKKSSGVATDVTEDAIRAVALPRGLVDIKVCAVSAVWSGLKLVVPVKDRPAKQSATKRDATKQSSTPKRASTRRPAAAPDAKQERRRAR